MGEVTIIGVDLAKNVFQVHGAAADGSVVFRKKLSRPQFARFMADQPPCLVAMEACASAHYWAREFSRVGHDVELIAPQFVKPYVKSQKNDANDAEALYELGLVSAQLKQFKQARQMFQQLLEQPSWRTQASLLLGKLAAEEQQIDKALGWFDSITQGPLAFEASLSSVSLLMNQKRVQEALGRVKIMQTSFPEQKARLMMIEAEIYNGQKQHQKAFDILTAALHEKPRQKELLYARALVAEKLDRLDVLEDDLRKILVDHPDDANALNALGYTLADRTERYVEAEEYLKRALELAPDEAVIIDSYGWLLYRLGRLEEAEGYLRRAYQRLPEGEIAAHWIEVLLALGRIDEARKVFAEALVKVEDKQHLFDLQRRFEVLH